MDQSQTHWEEWIGDERICALFWQAGRNLKFAWNLDQKDPDIFPFNTSEVFSKLLRDLRNKPPGNAIESLPEPPLGPECLTDLVDEKTIRAVYEYQNRGSYKGALIEAARGGEKGPSVWRKILNAVDRAYEIDHYGAGFAPMPKVHFLHNKLLGLAMCEPLKGLSDSGIAEFFNSICPCGKTHRKDAIRKLRERQNSRR